MQYTPDYHPYLNVLLHNILLTTTPICMYYYVIHYPDYHSYLYVLLMQYTPDYYSFFNVLLMLYTICDMCYSCIPFIIQTYIIYSEKMRITHLLTELTY